MLNLLQLLPGRIIKMSADKEKVASNCYPQQRNRHYSAETTFKTRLRRRQLYKQLSPDKKETLLSQRRSRKLESRSQCVLFGCYEEASCSKARVELHGETPLTIRESSCLRKLIYLLLMTRFLRSTKKRLLLLTSPYLNLVRRQLHAMKNTIQGRWLLQTKWLIHLLLMRRDLPLPKGRLLLVIPPCLNLSRKACLRNTIYCCITADNFSPEYLLDCLNLSSKHHGLEVANKIDAILHVWRLENCCYSFSP